MLKEIAHDDRWRTLPPFEPAHVPRTTPMKRQMKTNMLATSLLLSLGLSVASAGQPDPRFYGIWVGVETYEIPAHGAPHGQWGKAPVKKSAR